VPAVRQKLHLSPRSDFRDQLYKSIKSGQKIILHTDPGLPGGGCLTYVGPSGDLGGFVSWNANCSHGTSWMIK
jgi:hypothetical protein